jgi:hypothetical protein
LSRDRLPDPRPAISPRRRPEEILLRQQELATDDRCFLSAGLSSSFGSIYNNVVNPRFGNGDAFF